MKKLIAILLLLHSACFAQQTIPAVGNATSLWHTGGMLTSDVNFRLPHTKHCIPFFDSTGNKCYVNDTEWVHNGAIWVPNVSSGGGGVSQIYNYYGTIIHGGDSIEVDTPKLTTTYQNTLNEKIANKIGSNGTPNSTNYYNAAATNTLNAAIYTATADSVSGRVKYRDSLTRLYVTGYQDDTAKRAIRSAIPTNNNQLTNGSNYATLTNVHDTSAGIYAYIQALPSFGITSTNITHWNTAYDKSITGLGFSGGTFTFTSHDATTQTVSLDGRYLKIPDTTGLWLGAGAPVVLTTGSYANPAWITSLAWSKLTGLPSTAGGYGITDVYTKTASDARYAQAITLNTTGVLYTSPVTFTNNGSGTFTGSLTLASQSANMVLAGPTSGGSTTPAFRSLVAADIPDLSATYTPLSTVNSQTGTTYTLVAGDKGKVVSFNNSSAITLTIPASLGSTFYCTIQQNGTGQITFTASSTTLHVYNSYTKTAGQYAEVSIIFTPTADTYILQGLMQ